MFTGLIIDPQRMQHQILRPVLYQNFGKDPDSAFTMDSAEEFIKSKPYDYVLLDPITDSLVQSINTLINLKKNGHILPYCAIIIISADGSPKYITACADISPDDFLLKPAKSSDVIARLSTALNRKNQLKRPYLEFQRTGRLTETTKLFEVALKQATTPIQQSQVLKALVQLHITNDSAIQANSWLVKLKKINPGPLTTLLEAEILISRNQEEEAVKILELMLEQNQMLLSGYDLLAEASYKSGNAELGLKSRFKANTINPLNFERSARLANEAFELKDFETAKNTLEFQISNLEDHKISEKLAMLSQIHLEQDNMEACLEVLAIATKKIGQVSTENSPMLTIALLNSTISQGNHEQADELLNRLIALDENTIGPKTYLVEAALCAYRLEELDQGDHWLERMLLRQSLSFSQFQRIKEEMNHLDLSDRLAQISLKAAKSRAQSKEQQDQFKKADMFYELAQDLLESSEHNDASTAEILSALEALNTANEMGQLHMDISAIVDTIKERVLKLSPNASQEQKLQRLIGKISSKT